MIADGCLCGLVVQEIAAPDFTVDGIVSDEPAQPCVNATNDCAV